MNLTHKIALDPTCRQRRYFAQAAGAHRFTYNWALAEWNRQYEAGEKPSGAKLKLQFNAAKYELFPWMKDVHRDSHSQPFADLQTAFGNFFAKRAERPTFKKRGRHEAFYVANDKFRLDGNRVRLPVVGWVRLRESLRFTGRIMSGRVVLEAGRWFLCVAVEVGDYSLPRTGDDTAGVDLGIKTLATISTETGDVAVQNPKPLAKALRRLRRAQRKVSRRVKGSENRKKQCRVVARLHRRVSDIRHDVLNKLTTSLCKNHASVVIEDLNVAGMVKNRCLSRAISDVGFGTFRRMMEYKSIIFGTKLVIVDRFFPSSKKCSCCGHVKATLRLSERTYSCEVCGNQVDRDVNAARNLRTVGLTETQDCGPEGYGSRRKARVKPCRAEAVTNPCPQLATI